MFKIIFKFFDTFRGGGYSLQGILLIYATGLNVKLKYIIQYNDKLSIDIKKLIIKCR
jgi:hypothetical protein